MEALLLCCSSIQINHLYHLRGGLFHKERSNGWIFLNTISRTTLLGFFHVLISWYMKGWNPQMVSCVLCWWFSYNTSSTMQSVWAKQGQEYYGHPFCTVFYRCLSCCQKFNGFFLFFFFLLWEVVPQPTQIQLWRLGFPWTKKTKRLQVYKITIKVN